MCIGFARRNPVRVFLAEGLVFVDAAGGFAVALVHPELPAGAFALEQVAGENAVAGGILNVDVEGVAGHANNEIKVQLQVMADTLFDAEVVVLGAVEPGAEL